MGFHDNRYLTWPCRASIKSAGGAHRGETLHIRIYNPKNADKKVTRIMSYWQENGVVFDVKSLSFVGVS